MDNKMNNHGERMDESHGCCGGGKSMRSHWLKGIVALAVVGVVLAGGVSIGKEFGHRRSEQGGRFGMMGRARNGFDGSSAEGDGYGYGMMGRSRSFGMMGGFFGNDGNEDGKGDAARLFGVISSVEGNKITVKDNAGADQVILSQADTVIISAGAEVGLSSLKAGQSVVLVGSTNKDGQKVAKWINVVQ